MAHNHSFYDNDTEFTIDRETRNITNASGKMVTVMQYDHNSELVTFRMPRYIEGDPADGNSNVHDMSECDIVQVFYENTSRGTSASGRTTVSGANEVTNSVKVDPVDKNFIVFNWLIGQETTQLAGTIRFQIRFVCHSDDENTLIPEFSWRTNLCTAFNVLSSLDTVNDVVEAYPDIFIELDKRMDQLELSGVSDQRLADGINNYLTEHPISDGKSAYDVAVDNGFEGTEEEWLESLKAAYNSTTVKLDFTNWDNGSFTETLADGTVYDYGVTLDDRGLPTSFTLPDGRVMDVVIPVFEEEDGIVYYKYNDAILPALPEWNQTLYPYAIITKGGFDQYGATKYYLSISEAKVTKDDSGKCRIPMPSFYAGCSMNANGEVTSHLDNGGWSEFIERDAETYAEYIIVWTNTGHDVGDIIGNDPVKMEEVAN